MLGLFECNWELTADGAGWCPMVRTTRTSRRRTRPGHRTELYSSSQVFPSIPKCLRKGRLRKAVVSWDTRHFESNRGMTSYEPQALWDRKTVQADAENADYQEENVAQRYQSCKLIQRIVAQWEPQNRATIGVNGFQWIEQANIWWFSGGSSISGFL